MLTLTFSPDDDLDRQRSDAAEAMRLLTWLAHRGNGDWSRHYESGEIGLALLREARDHPGAKIIEHAIGELALPPSKGKGKAKANDSLDDTQADVKYSGQYSSAYSGVSRPPLSPIVYKAIYSTRHVGYNWKVPS